MDNQSDQVFYLDGKELTALPSRSMREGLLGKTLEDALQTFLEQYPQVIPGKQIDPSAEDPPRFVLLRREMPIGGWSLDHLYVDQKSILTLVETKLFQNPESRREVIGQIIEYATNSKEFWGSGAVRQKATEFWNNLSPPGDLDQAMQDEFGSELDLDTFWMSVEDNLQRGRIRLIIATDELRPEVRRMIEYLNAEMKNVEVLGLELKCYGKDQTPVVLVPRLAGQTQSVIDGKRKSDRSIKWTVDKLNETFSEMDDQELGKKFCRILKWAVDKNVFSFSTAMSPHFGLQGKNTSRIVSLNKKGNIYVIFKDKAFLGGVADRDRLIGKLKDLQLIDTNIDPKKIIDGRDCTRTLAELSEDEINKFMNVLEEFLI